MFGFQIRNDTVSTLEASKLGLMRDNGREVVSRFNDFRAMNEIHCTETHPYLF